MKLKNTFKIIAFILVFVVLITSLTGAFVTVDSLGYQCIAGFYEEPEDSLDAVYIGSSNVIEYWNSLFAWEEYGISVYPYACSNNTFYSTEYLIKEARKTQPDAVFVVNTNSVTDGEINLQQFRKIIDCMPFSFNKLALINHLADVGDYSFEDSLEYYLPLIRYHSRWNEIDKSDFSKELNGYKGSSVYTPYFKGIEDVSSSYVATDKKSTLSEKLVSSTESLLDYCDRENVKVVFVTVPQARGKEYDVSRSNALNAMIEERGYPVLDLTERAEEMGIDYATDFYNKRHTNIHGSIKLTYYMSEYLIENYGFKDKRNDKNYSEWNTSYEKYAEKISPYVLDFETDAGVRTDALEAPKLWIKEDADKTTLCWSKIEKATGYVVYRKQSAESAWEKLSETTDVNYAVSMPDGEETHYYTVVPFLEENGSKYYGDFSYQGIQLTASE